MKNQVLKQTNKKPSALIAILCRLRNNLLENTHRMAFMSSEDAGARVNTGHSWLLCCDEGRQSR